MRKFWAEFKAFIAKGNVVDLAVAVIIGGAFNKIVSSLVNDIIMPLVSLMVGGKDVTDWKWVIREAQYDATGNVVVAESALKYGIFIQTIIDFLIIALTVFIIVKIFNASKKKLDEISHSVVAEAKKLSKKESKLLKKNKKKGIVAENVVEENVPAQEDVSTETVAAESVAVADTPVDEVAVAEQVSETSNKDEELLQVLKEIRDYIKK